MSLTNTFETNLLKLIFQNIALADIGNGAGLPPATLVGDIFVSLHTADPGEAAADQSVSECAYTGTPNYTRQSVVRSAVGWVVTGNICDNAALIQYSENTGASETATNFGLGFALSGTTTLYMLGTSSLVISTNVQPEFAIGALDISLD